MERNQIIQEIEHLRSSKLISYLTSNRPGRPANAVIGMDVVPLMSQHLRKIGKTQKIDLFLFSTGGNTMVPWRVVSMIREYCETFSVLIPYKAHSAATMVALGADEIVMSDISELSPIDPSTANVFNPVDPLNSQNRLPISVEDVIAYFDLAREKFGIKNEVQLADIFLKFVDANPQIHPLALGNVNRTHTLIRILARRLLKSHKEAMLEEEINKIVGYFTEKLYSHQYFIGRKEAKEELGLKNISYSDASVDGLLTKLFDSYNKEMQDDKLWSPENEIELSGDHGKKEYKIAFIESLAQTNYFSLVLDFRRQQVSMVHQTPQGPINIPQEQVGWRIIKQEWN